MSLKRYYISTLHPHIWEHPEGEMVYFEDYVTLKAENARLKAEVEHLTQELKDEKSANANVEGRQQSANRNLGMENARLKAEVECWEFIHRLDSLAINKQKEEIDRLKAEVERLRKAGDVLESGLRTLPGDFPRCLANEWTAAKEGKQS